VPRRRYRTLSALVDCFMHADEPEEQRVVDRIIALRARGWSFQRIGAQLQSEGFKVTDPSSWETEIMRRLIRQRRH
jgi:hypothetical protein